MLIFFSKKDHKLVINGSQELLLEHKETVLNGALRHNIKFPHSCKVGGCGTCKCRLISGKVKEFTDKSYLLSKQEIAENYILACQSMPKSDVVIEIPNWDENSQEIAGHISGIETLTHDISRVSVSLESYIRYKAGQYVSIQPQDADIPARCYSFAQSNKLGGNPLVSFFVRGVVGGRMSNWLMDPLNINATVTLSAANGDFYLRDQSAPVVCVAGGSGLAPIIALIEDAIQNNSAIVDQPLTLLMGVRSQRDIYYQDQINSLGKLWRNEFRFTPVLSDEPEGSNWQGCRGLVTDYIDEKACVDGTGYLCGPPPMIDAAMSKMQASGIDSNKIFFDKFLDQSGLTS
jgi:NAD(P)H-flavin reductase/ferredoxin